MGDSLDLSTIRHYAESFKGLEEKNRKASLTVRFEGKDKVYSIKCCDADGSLPKLDADKLENKSARRALMTSISHTKGYSPEAVSLAKEILCGKNDEDLNKPLDSRVFRKLEVALSSSGKNEGSVRTALTTMQELAEGTAKRFANKFTSDQFGTLYPKLESMYLSALEAEIAKDKTALENVDRLLWTVENRVYAENKELFAALDEAQRLTDKWCGVLESSSGDDVKSPDQELIQGEVNESKLQGAAKTELEKLLRSCYKESIAHQLLSVRDGAVPTDDALRQTARESVGKVCALFKKEVPGLLETVKKEFGLRDVPQASLQFLDDLIAKEFAVQVFKAGEKEKNGLAKLDFKALVNGTGKTPGLLAKMEDVAREYLKAQTQITATVRKQFDDVSAEDRAFAAKRAAAVRDAELAIEKAFEANAYVKADDVRDRTLSQLVNSYSQYLADVRELVNLRSSVPNIVTEIWGKPDDVPMPEPFRRRLEQDVKNLIQEKFSKKKKGFSAQAVRNDVISALRKRYGIDLYKTVMTQKESLLKLDARESVRTQYENLARQLLEPNSPNTPKSEGEFRQMVWKGNDAAARMKLNDYVVALEKKIAEIKVKAGRDNDYLGRLKKFLGRTRDEDTPEFALFWLMCKLSIVQLIESKHFLWTLMGADEDFGSRDIEPQKGVDKKVYTGFRRTKMKSQDAFKRLCLPGAPYKLNGSELAPLEREFLDEYRKRVKTALAPETTAYKELNEWKRKIKAASDKLDSALNPADVDAYAKVVDEFDAFVKDLTEPIAKEVYEELLASLPEAERRMLPHFAGDCPLALDNATAAVQRLGYSVQEIGSLPDETLALLGRFNQAHLSLESHGTMIEQGKAGLLPPELMTQKAILLVKSLLDLKRLNLRETSPKIGKNGMDTNDARKVLFALRDNGFLKAVEHVDRNKIDCAAEAISLLYAINGGPVGLDDLCQRVFKKTIDKVTEADVKNVSKQIADNVAKDADKPFAGIDPMRNLTGSAAHVHAFLTGESTLQELPLAKDAKATDGLQKLCAGLERLRLAQVVAGREPPSETVQIAGVKVVLSRDERGRIHFEINGEKCATGLDVTALIDALTLAFVSDVQTFGAKTVESMLPGRKLAKPSDFGVGARDVCTAFLKSASGLPTVRFARLGIVQLNNLAHRVLDGMAGKSADQIQAMIADELAKTANDGLNAKETIEQCQRAERAAKAVDAKVVIDERAAAKDGSADTSVSPERKFAAELFLRQQTWKDDGVPKNGERLQAIFQENAALLHDLMADESRYDEMKIALGTKDGQDLVTPLKAAVEAIRNQTGVKAGAVPTLRQILAALKKPGAKTALDTLSGALARAGDALLESAQTMFTNQFVAALKSSSVSLDDLELKTLHQLAGVGSLDLSKGFGKFLGEAFSNYFKSAAGADKDAILRSLIAGTKPGAKPVDVMTALVKGSGPVFQKLVQGVPLNALDESLRPIVEMSKSSLDPIPRDIVKAKLFDMVERSNGRIQSIEVKKSLGAASVGEALLCVVKTRENPYGEECVIKLLRPDVQTRAQRENRFLTGIAAGTPGVPETFAGRYAGIEEEMDLTIEARNVGLGRIYSPSGKGHAANGVDSMTLNPLVSPTPGAIVLNKAPGETFDSLVSSAKKRVEEIAGCFRHSVKEGDKVVTVMTSKSAPRAVAAKKELLNLYSSLHARHKKLIEFSRMWTEDAIFTSGIFHGDLHAGNIMIDDDLLTVIDYGNVSKLNKDDRNKLMSIIASCSVNSPASAVSAILGLMSPSGRKAFDADKQKKLTEKIGKIFQKGSTVDAPLRLAAVIRLLEGEELEIPTPLFNFAQSLTRLQETIDSVEDAMSRAKALAKDITFDDSDYDKEEIACLNFSSRPIKARISKSNPLDFMGAFAAHVKNLPKRTVQQTLDDTYPLLPTEEKPATEGPKYDCSSRIFGGFMPTSVVSKDNELIEKLRKTVYDLTSSPENFGKLKSYLAESIQMNGNRLRGVEDGRVGADEIDSILRQFANGKDPWNDEEARKKLANEVVTKYVQECTKDQGFADYLYPEFGTPQSYGDVVYDLVLDHQKEVQSGSSVRLISEAGLYFLGSRKKIDDSVDAANVKAHDEVEAWLENHRGFSHYDAEKLKAIGNTLLRFNDDVFLPFKSGFFSKSHWSLSGEKRANFLKGMEANLKAVEDRLAQLGLSAKDDYTRNLQMDCLMTYYRERTDIKGAFSKKDNYEMTLDLYEDLEKDAINMSGGKKDAPLVKCIQSFRTFAKGISPEAERKQIDEAKEKKN